MAELILKALTNCKSYNFAVDAIEEYIPKLLDAYAEIDAQLVSDGDVLKGKIDDYVSMMGGEYDEAQAIIDLGLSTEVDEPDITVPPLPTHVYVELPVFNLAIDLRQLAVDFVTLFNSASRKIELVFENLSWIKTLSDRWDGFLDLISIPLSDNLTYMKPIEVATGQEPQGEWIIDMWFDHIKNETTDVWMVVGKGEDFTPPESITVLVIWKALVYWKVFSIIYKAAKKVGIIDLAKKFAGKIMRLPGIMFSRYSINKRLRKTAALTTVQVALAIKPEVAILDSEIETIDGIVDNILSKSNIIEIDTNFIQQKFEKAYSPQKGVIQF